MFSLRFYRMYDIGREVDLSELEEALTRSYSTARAGFVRVRPKSIIMEDPPLMIRMQPFRVERDGKIVEFTVAARLYDVGVISFCFTCEDAEGDLVGLSHLAFLFPHQEGLADYFVRYLMTLAELIRPHIRDFALNPDFFEDYTIYATGKRDDTFDPVPLMLNERNAIAPALKQEITANSLSYTPDDLAILSWDAAFLCDVEYPADIIDLIEFANVQVLELRYYDKELSRQMEKMYDDIEGAERLTQYSRMRRYHTIMSGLLETQAEISETVEKVDNLIKVTEDVYYARVYATALKVMRSGQWSESVNKKIEVIRETYTMLSGEVRIQHSNFLEWIVIVLIAIEIGFAVWEFFIKASI
ncbi:MAG TPA: hypothetical protein P5217_04260 [Methanoregulaceae archaeon]|nr:hypothetical protein [Methanoregulaceae archaeon]HPD75115.1 hypothetical protein [Methanoregulaceae archaeon]HRY75478.1 hypothetical protein [Methanoregulaceae archaeon]